MTELDGGPAFPTHLYDQTKGTGMSLRDWFAGQALGGMLQYYDSDNPEVYAESAYIFADAMLVERAKEKQ